MVAELAKNTPAGEIGGDGCAGQAIKHDGQTFRFGIGAFVGRATSIARAV